MLRALYSGISGMKVNQTKLDVIGNNIANVGTTAFKSQRARFSTTLSQTMTSASSPSTNKGGVNASQVGLGVKLASIDSVMTNGNLQSTSRPLDVAIDKTGYFIVSSGPVVSNDNEVQVNQAAGQHNIVDTGNSSLLYTRDGSFVLDQQGNLLTSDGYRIMGYSVTNDDSSAAATEVASNPVSLGAGATPLNFVFGPGSQLNGYKVVLGTIASGTSTTATVDKTAKEIVINGDFSSTSSLTTDAIQTAVKLGLSTAGISQTVSVAGKIPTFTDLSTTAFTGGTATVAPTATTNTVAGNSFTFGTGTELNGYKIVLGKISVGTTTEANIDAKNKIITINGDFITAGAVTTPTLQGAINTALTAKGFTQTITVGGAPTTFANTESGTTSGGTPVQSIATDGDINFVDGNITVKAYDSSLKSIKIPEKVKLAGSTEELKVVSYSIQKTGLVTATLEDGSVAALGQIAMATFKNQEGLTRLEGDLFSTSANSGDAIVKSGLNTLQDDNSEAYGETIQGYLEMSNVDLSEQFTDMISATRAFQANTKIISTGDEILQDIINLKR